MLMQSALSRNFSARSPLWRRYDDMAQCLNPLARIDLSRSRIYFPPDVLSRAKYGGVIISRRERDLLIAEKSIRSQYIEPIPCGKCINCRLNYQREWSVRCMLEAQDHADNSFLTLTYDDKHLPFAPTLDLDDGTVSLQPSLFKKDVQDFMKNLRIKCEREFGITGLRYYLCGEYGDQNHRPHYHVLLFGMDFPDKKRTARLSRADPNLMESEFLSSVWKNGLSAVGTVTYDSCAYVSGYVMKKAKGFSAVAQVQAIDTALLSFNDPVSLDNQDLRMLYRARQGEFVEMSTRPGIASKYFDEHFIEIYANDKVVTSKYGSVKPPRYYDKKFDLIDPEEFEKLSKRRYSVSSARQAAFLDQIGLTEEGYLERLAVQSRATRILTRNQGN